VLEAVVYSRAALGLLFLATAILKLADWRAFKRAVAGFELVSDRATPVVAMLVAGLEIAGGAMLATGLAVRLGAALMALLLAAFNLALIVNLLRGRRRLDCQCYGRSAVRIGWGHVAQNTALLAVAALAGIVSEPPVASPGRVLILLASAQSAALFLAAQHMAGVRAGLIRMLSRIEIE
jgi:hypothetical protein